MNLSKSTVTLIYFIGAILYFPKSVAFPCKVAYPTILLCLSLFFIHLPHNGFIFLALFFSALGDASGALGLFIFQMAFFALGHFFYVAHFFPHCTKIDKKRVFLCLIVAVSLIAFEVYLFPFIHDDFEKYGIMGYSVIIFSMLALTSFYQGDCQLMFLFAAILFIISDMTLAYDRYFGAKVWRDYVIMITYYGAQFLFWRYSIERAELLDAQHPKKL